MAKSILAAVSTALAQDHFLEPQHSSCPGGSLLTCIQLCPTSPASVFSVCVESCADRCSESTTTAAPPTPVPTPTPPPPPPPTPPPTPPSPPGPPLYCPDESSWVFEGATWNGAGWTANGGGGVTSKTSFNLLGGYVEFDVDNSGSKWGVNNNFYTISPDHPYTNRNDYCDGQGPEASSPLGIYCMEMDIYEANGAQNLATTWHTWFNHDGGCDQGGCGAGMDIGGQFHVKAQFGEDGFMHTYFNGNEIGGFSPYPSSNAVSSVRDTMNSRGVVFSSSQWTGWVPGAGNVNGDVDNSVFSIRNVRVSGSVVMGPEPPRCTGPSPSPSPSPSPTPTPTPTPGPSCDCGWAASGCGRDDGSACFKECCSSKCDCSWAASGCGWNDGSTCFHQCCGYEMANSTEISV